MGSELRLPKLVMVVLNLGPFEAGIHKDMRQASIVKFTYVSKPPHHYHNILTGPFIQVLCHIILLNAFVAPVKRS